MKVRNYLFALAATTGMMACGSQETDTTTDTDTTAADTAAAEVEAVTYTIDADESEVMWSGSAVGGAYGHFGTLSFKEGSITLEGDKIVDGSFVVDMTTINPTDSNYTEEKTPEKLVGHLSTGDFFMVDSFPTASFVLTEPGMESVKGDMTIRGNTNPVTVTITSVEETEDGIIAKGKTTLDRQEYEVDYESAMKDFAISNDMEVEITIVGSKE